MKKLFMIQNTFLKQEDFLKNISKDTGIPLNIIKDKYKNDNQILINEHYFKNIFKNNFSNLNYDSVLKALKEEDYENKIFDLMKNKYEIFFYEIIE